MTPRQFFVAVTFVAFSSVSAAQACDFCSLYTATESRRDKSGDIQLSISEQYSYSDTLQNDGDEIANAGDEWLKSSTTQVILRYNLLERLGLQANLPFIHRAFKQNAETGSRYDEVSGIGDSSLLADYLAYHHEENELAVFVHLRAGVKLPTGDTDELASHGAADHDEMPMHAEDEHAMGSVMDSDHSMHDEHEMADLALRHAGHSHEVISGLHGHDIALGSGSIDSVIGASTYVRYARAFAALDVQYFMRSEGDYDYRYANALAWSAGPGAFFYLEHDMSAALRLKLSGEYKEKDVVDGVKENDTAMTSMYIGPELLLTRSENLSAELGIDLPVVLDNSGTQIVPDYRIRVSAGTVFNAQTVSHSKNFQAGY